MTVCAFCCHVVHASQKLAAWLNTIPFILLISESLHVRITHSTLFLAQAHTEKSKIDSLNLWFSHALPKSLNLFSATAWLLQTSEFVYPHMP